MDDGPGMPELPVVPIRIVEVPSTVCLSMPRTWDQNWQRSEESNLRCIFFYFTQLVLFGTFHVLFITRLKLNLRVFSFSCSVVFTLTLSFTLTKII